MRPAGGSLAAADPVEGLDRARQPSQGARVAALASSPASPASAQAVPRWPATRSPAVVLPGTRSPRPSAHPSSYRISPTRSWRSARSDRDAPRTRRPASNARSYAFVGLDVGVDRHRAVARHPAERPGLVPALGLEVVERERPDLLVERDAGACLDRLADPGMEVAPPAVRQALVGRVADERVAEPQVARRLLLDEVAEPRPRLGVDARRPRGRRPRAARGRSSCPGPRRSAGSSGRSRRAGRSGRRSSTRSSPGAIRATRSRGRHRAARRGTSAFPPERRAISSASCGWSGASSVTVLMMSMSPSVESGSSSTVTVGGP